MHGLKKKISLIYSFLGLEVFNKFLHLILAQGTGYIKILSSQKRGDQEGYQWILLYFVHNRLKAETGFFKFKERE
jgi:hypothetical protein